MKLVNDIIKMRYVKDGYLPDHPYHLVSDEEMIDAFMDIESKSGYFYDKYPCPGEEFESDYDVLVKRIQEELQLYVLSIKDGGPVHEIPDWVYAYMIGSVIGPYSDMRDRHDLFVLLGTDNLEDEFNSECYKECYKASNKWLGRYVYRDDTTILRPPTIFGEPHVVKYLRLREANALRKE